MPKQFTVPCNGDAGIHTVKKIADDITFNTGGKCNFTSFQFVGNTGAFKPKGVVFPSQTVTYTYDGSDLPPAGVTFQYKTDKNIILGNGTGVIKN